MSKRKPLPDDDDVFSPPLPTAAPAPRLAPALAAAADLAAKMPKKRRPGQRPPGEAAPAKPKTPTGQRRAVALDVGPKSDLLTGPEAAGYLRVSVRTLLRVAKEGALGHVMIGGRVRFTLEDLDRYARGEAPRAGALVGWDRLRAPKTPRKAV